ncbi:MAG: MFS transporter [Burkholderiaceae bacterium]|nr:MFS transporter [Burkholderiaceae bacterium]
MTLAAGGASQRGFACVLASLIALHACMASTRIAASLAVLQQGYPAWVVGGLLSLYAVAPILLSLWAGRMADRFGFHRPVAWSVAMAGVGAALPVATQHIAALAVSGLLTGGALSTAAVTIQREAGRMARDADDLKRVFSWVALGPALSNTVAPVITGLLIDHVGFRAAFGFGALLPLLGAWAAWQVPRGVPTEQVPAGPALPGSGAFDLLRQPMLRNLLLVNVAMAAAWDSHSFTVPVVGHARELSASAIGLVLSSFAIASTAVRVVILTWGEHIGEQRALVAAITLATGVLMVYAWLPGTLGMILGSAVLGIALGSVQPMVLAMLHQAAPPQRQGQALALRMLFTNAATISMPLLFGLLAAATGNAAPMWLMAVMLVAARWPVRRLGAPANAKLEADTGRV